MSIPPKPHLVERPSDRNRRTAARVLAAVARRRETRERTPEQVDALAKSERDYAVAQATYLAAREAGDPREFGPWLEEYTAKKNRDAELKWLRQQSEKRNDPVEARVASVVESDGAKVYRNAAGQVLWRISARPGYARPLRRVRPGRVCQRVRLASGRRAGRAPRRAARRAAARRVARAGPSDPAPPPHSDALAFGGAS